MKGIYIHIPFCRKKCIYCDFTIVDTSNKFCKEAFDDYTNLVCTEIDIRLSRLPDLNNFRTIYLGGGTPSFIGVDNISKILNKIFSYIPFSDFEEITIEANPEDVSLDFAKQISDFGINRISLGIQSMNDSALEILSRRNTSQINHTALDNLSKVNFANVNVDVIFDIPGIPVSEIMNTLDLLLDYDIVKHVSAYGLTVEEFTPLKLFIDRGVLKYPDSFETQFIDIHNYLVAKGFNHYEISNYSIRGYESRHNLMYWNRCEYLGIGISACGFLKRQDGSDERYQNVISLRDYRSKLENGEVPIRYREVLSCEQAFEELLMLGLRKSEGLSLSSILSLFGDTEAKKILAKVDKLVSEGLLEYEGNFIKSTLKGWLLNDSVVLELISYH